MAAQKYPRLVAAPTQAGDGTGSMTSSVCCACAGPAIAIASPSPVIAVAARRVRLNMLLLAVRVGHIGPRACTDVRAVDAIPEAGRHGPRLAVPMARGRGPRR